MHKYSYIVFIMTLFFVRNIHANMDENFEEGLNAGTTHQTEAHSALKSFDPNTTFKNYDPHPPETTYFKGGTQTSTTLIPDAAKTASATPVGNAVMTSFNTRPQFSIDMNSPEMKNSTMIQNNATDIVNGISNEFVDCNKKQTCTTTYETKTCSETPASFSQTCKKTLTVTMVPKEIDTHYKFTAHLETASHDYAAIIFNLVTGQIVDKGPSDASGYITGRMPYNIDCHSLHGTVVKISPPTGVNLNYIYFPSCTNGLTLNFRFTTSSSHLNVNMDVDIVSSKITQIPEDHWEDACSAISSNSTCTLKNEACLEPNTTHTVDDKPITRACWEMEDIYNCKGGELTNACQPLIDQGCQQIGSECTQKVEDGCSLYNQTFRCPIKNCTDNGIICNGETYCLTEDCMKHTKVADPDFQKAVSSLSAVDAAAHEFDSESTFAGIPKSCSSEPLGFSNCCQDSGWGVDMNLTQCTQQEKELGQAKENKEVVFIGSFCDKNTLGICITHKKSYCVFPSVLDRIIQEQGRGGELHIPFGSAEHPDCRGITPDELQKINFDLIDFTDFYADITQETEIENSENINDRMMQDMKQMTGDNR